LITSRARRLFCGFPDWGFCSLQKQADPELNANYDEKQSVEDDKQAGSEQAAWIRPLLRQAVVHG